MEDNIKEKLKELRIKYPIGIQEGLVLLQQAKGDLYLAENLFKEKKLDEIILKTEVSKEVAIAHLTKCNYDIYLTINSIDEERYTFTERVLKKFNQDKFTGLKRIAGEVERNENILRNGDVFWFTIEHLNKLPPELYCLVLIMEWLNYEDYEGLDHAIYFHLDKVIFQITNQLQLPQIAQTLHNARTIYQDQLEEENSRLIQNGYSSPSLEYIEQEKIFENEKPLLLNALFKFVNKHIDKFPKK